MAAAFLLWSCGAASDLPPPELQLSSPLLTEPAIAVPAPARPKPRKASKSGGPKRPPQRGLGVAQLERLRLQERWQMITDGGDTASPPPLPALPAYDAHVPIYPVTSWMGECHIPWGSSAVVGGASAVQSQHHDRHSMDRARISAIQSLLLEPPSNQSQKLPCAADHCAFCARMKKRPFIENPCFRRMDGHDSLVTNLDYDVPVDEAFGGYKAKEREEVKEYEFFPRNRGAVLGDSEQADPIAGDASPSAASTPGALDLTLKLSY